METSSKPTLCIAAFGLDYYTEVMDLSYLLEHLPESAFFKKYKKLNEALIGLVEDYSLVSFIPMNVQVCLLNSTKLYTIYYLGVVLSLGKREHVSSNESSG